MKIIDEKGKLFGKINLIDCIVIVILVAALAFLAVRFLRPAGSSPIGNTTKLTYTAQVMAVDEATYKEVLRQLEATEYHDQLMANGELLDAYVTNLVAEPHVTYNPDDSGRIVRYVEDEPNGRWDLTFTVEAEVDSIVTNKLGTQEVRVGKSHILKTTHIEFAYSNIVTCEWE